MRSQGKYTGDTTAGELPGALKKVLYADIQDLAAVFCARDSKNIFFIMSILLLFYRAGRFSGEIYRKSGEIGIKAASEPKEPA